ncbi:DNA-binding response OmpR family regulator [Microvirga flocculans]|uniref:DNA-binding response OmpR family regulator n=2 Tax=Microvirga flocculans TaxID=217168 RepID=A0A7W6N6V1_9HYPH|nr:response regulator [Microvirga flocculans]MBB4038972.1 DNA-binding response OmpR family regulator [Microvirga flocculans]
MRILILEDDPAIAFDLQAILEGEGHEIVDSVSSLAEVYEHIDDDLDCALLDIDVVGGKSFGVAEMLMERHIPFAFVSASNPSDLPCNLQEAAFVAKPFEERALLRAVMDIAPHQFPC